MTSVFFHIDLDAFFAAAEVLDDPSLAGRPVIVGAAPGHRGVVSTCSYEARRYGVHSAMPISEAYRLCPEAAFRPVRMERYAELSARVMAVFEAYTPDVVRVSIDEASLDMTGTERLWGAPREAAEAIRDRVARETGLSISIGIAPNRYVAKVASGVRKPAGLVVVEPGDEAAFMAGLRLKDLWGVGPKTRARLEELGIGDQARLLELSRATLESNFGKAGGEFIYGVARGVDPGIYAGEARSRSISSETTYERDEAGLPRIETTLLGMAEELVARLYADGYSSRCVALKLRYGDFETVGVRETLDEPFFDSGAVYEAARSLLARKWDGRPLRLVGLALACLERGAARQAGLFDDGDDRVARVERAGIEAARRGLGKLTRARLLHGPGLTRPKPS